MGGSGKRLASIEAGVAGADESSALLVLRDERDGYEPDVAERV